MNAIYKLPKSILASLAIGGGILFILYNNPPYTFCDSQVEQFKKIQTGFLYRDPTDFHREKSKLKRKQNLCYKEGAPGVCYEYFALLKKLLRDFRVLSSECVPLIYSTQEVKSAFSSALTLMTALAWRKEVVSGVVSKYNWLNRADLILFCDMKRRYITQYGRESYQILEKEILKNLPLDQKIPLSLLIKKTILSESCQKYI